MKNPITTRAPKGGAFESRDRFFARVTVDTGKRTSVALPWATSLDAARERACILQGLTTALRAAGEHEWLDRVLEVGARADEAKLAGSDPEEEAAQLLAVLKGLDESGFPLRDAGFLQDEFLDQQREGVPMGSKGRRLGERLGFAPELLGT